MNLKIKYGSYRLVFFNQLNLVNEINLIYILLYDKGKTTVPSISAYIGSTIALNTDNANRKFVLNIYPYSPMS